MSEHRLVAAFAANPNPGGPSHLFTDDTDHSLCGVQKGQQVSIVTCKTCLNAYAHNTPEGRRIYRTAGEAAIRQAICTATSLTNRPTILRQLAQAFAQHHDNQPTEPAP